MLSSYRQATRTPANNQSVDECSYGACFGKVFLKTKSGPFGPLYVQSPVRTDLLLAENLKNDGQENERSDNGAEYFVHDVGLGAKCEHVSVSWYKEIVTGPPCGPGEKVVGEITILN